MKLRFFASCDVRIHLFAAPDRALLGLRRRRRHEADSDAVDGPAPLPLPTELPCCDGWSVTTRPTRLDFVMEREGEADVL